MHRITLSTAWIAWGRSSSMQSFLSYPSERLPIARLVYEFLCSVGVRPWFDKESIVGGQDWDRERAAAQRASDVTFLIVSSETLTKAGVIQREIKDALELVRDKPFGQHALVPLL